ncbi:hypothetical protein ACG2F4_06580 [Halalkalibaculum sp. DA3122]|uniref:hypothetical protein n=1 Tax=Halalkalibaculum sp. DA3122 TaxID=3373607 RepID=UPI00375445B4
MSKNNEQKPFFKKLPEDGPITNIQVKGKQFILEIVESGEKGATTAIEAGNIQTILDNLKHEPAEAIELEAAIADIEDQLMPIIRDLPKRRCLVTSEETFWSIAKVAGCNTDDNLQLDIATVEEIFNRLADVAYGTPASRLGVPENREFAAAVLFLRELMHHAGFKCIILRH